MGTGIESFLLASSLKTIISQRLVRRLCNKCKVTSKPSSEISKSFQLVKIKISISLLCDHCNMTDIRKNNIRIVEVDKELKNLIHNNASENSMYDYVFKNAKSIDQVSIELVLNGTTSIDELIRINNIKDNGDL